jgi:hypothetical protein
MKLGEKRTVVTQLGYFNAKKLININFYYFLKVYVQEVKNKWKL